MRNTYFWNAETKEVIVKVDTVILGSEVVSLGLSGMYSVDEFNNKPIYRYGMYGSDGVWKHIPLKKFPPEFRVHLLLLE